MGRRVFILVALLACAACAKSLPPRPGLEDAQVDLRQAVAAFPGAEGFGTDTPAGRGGAIIAVTTLAGEGPGSLREALARQGARTIIFEVAGVIDLHDTLAVIEPFVTIAGQTAPSPGITLIGAGLVIMTHDVQVQHLRIRVGDRPEGPRPDARDGLGIIAEPGAGGEAGKVVVDHCSISWAIDEGLSTWYAGVHDVTISNCIIAENLDDSLHPKGPHSKGLLIGDHSRRVSVIGNLFAHNVQRNPLVKGDVSALIANNVIYNPKNGAIHAGDLERSGPSLAVMLHNVLVPGADTGSQLPLIVHHGDGESTTRLYGMGNDPGTHALFGSGRYPESWHSLETYDASPVRVLPLTLRETATLEAWVAAHAGARPADRDDTDARILRDLEARSGRIIDSQGEVGGFPVVAPVQRVQPLPDNPGDDPDGDGYTNIEAWLHAQAVALETLGW